MWYRNKYFHYSSAVLAALLIMFLAAKVSDLFRFPFMVTAAVGMPLIMAGFFYYLLRPVVQWLVQAGIPKTAAILIAYLLLAGLITLFIVYLGALAWDQTEQLIADLPRVMASLQDQGTALLRQRQFGAVLSWKVRQQLGTVLHKAVPAIVRSLRAALSGLTGLTGLMVTVPFILFYFLRDDRKFVAGLTSRVSRRYRKEVEFTLKETDRVLFTYVTGQALLAVGQGILMYFGFRLFGLAYPLVLALIMMITSFIPTFGALIGILPALVVALAAGLWMVVKVLGLLVVVNLLRKLAAPQLVGKRLMIHPLTTILLLLAAGAIFGLFGVLLAVPAYAVLKEAVEGGIRISRIREAGPDSRP